MSSLAEWVAGVVQRTPPLDRGQGLLTQVRHEVVWFFQPPWPWLNGVAFNLVLSLLWLVVWPLSGRPHQDWAIIVGSYFAVWILADVTTTNILGADAARVRAGLAQHVSLGRILVVKNLTLLALVGGPTLIATAVITVTHEADYRLTLTLPGVLLPILTWLGVGNLLSVLLPVATRPWRERWEERHALRPTGRWLVCMGLPYALLTAADPVAALPRLILRHARALPPTIQVRGAILCVLGLALWAAGTGLALLVNQLRPVQIS
ncbi:hypothetical protein [uncultured Friedmanniella sp.]|uniref:hypothetical protein n=1 Tax=uncultured Friedmanniella sp. TaxID=335381 RepID=UPI0035CB8720